jgi:hypothetical protein
MKYSMSFAQKSAPFEIPVFVGVLEWSVVKNGVFEFSLHSYLFKNLIVAQIALT